MIFSVNIPVYLPYHPRATEQHHLISQEYQQFQSKCDHNPRKRMNHEMISQNYKENDFRPGHEPYLIVKKGEARSWRGFLKLYKPNFNLDERPRETIRSFEGAKLRKVGQLIPNLDKETEEINRLIRLFREESFGLTDIESMEQFSKKMHLTLLLNRVKSISATRNKSLKRYTEDLDHDPSVLLIRAFWEPKWVKKSGAKYITVPLKEVRHFFLEYLKRDPENAIKFLINEEGDILGETFGGSVHVPYRQLREAIRIHPVKIMMVSRLRLRYPEAPLYEAIHDSDLVKLRIQRDNSESQADGLYSFYEEIIQEYCQKNSYCPPLVTSGYRAAYNTKIAEDLYPWLYAAIEEDRYIRQETSKINPSMTYYAEPNCLFYVTRTSNFLPHTFLGLDGDRISWSFNQTVDEFKFYDPREGVIILHQLLRQYPSTSVLYDATHPVIMTLPARMILNKKSKTTFNIQDFGTFDKTRHLFLPATPKALKVSENISQSPLSFRDYAITVYNQLGFKGLKSYYQNLKVDYSNSLFTSLFSSIFNAYDPVTYIESQGIQILRSLLPDSYDSFPKRFYMNTELVAGNDKIREVLIQINNLDKHQDQLPVLQNLYDDIYGKGIFQKLIETAHALGKERYKHIYYYYTSGLAHNNIRSSPLKSIEQSGLGHPHPRSINQVELEEVKRELYPETEVIERKPSSNTLKSEKDSGFPSLNSSHTIPTSVIPPAAAPVPAPLAPPLQYNFPSFTAKLFQDTLNQIYQRLGGNKIAREELYPVFGFTGQSAFYSAINLSNKSTTTYKKQWNNAIYNLPTFCHAKNIPLREIIPQAVPA